MRLATHRRRCSDGSILSSTSIGRSASPWGTRASILSAFNSQFNVDGGVTASFDINGHLVLQSANGFTVSEHVSGNDHHNPYQIAGVFPKGTAIPVRADFNTLDNPFAWSERSDEVGVTPAAGVHFVVFNPTGDDFHRNRLAMDGVLPGGKIPFKPRQREQGFNSVLSTTHRQNFLVPPRRHRAFPLAEL